MIAPRVINIIRSGPLTKRETLTMRRDFWRQMMRTAGRLADQQIDAAVDAANALHLRTAWRHTREAWRLWGECAQAELEAREAERELAAMDAS